MNKKLIEPNNLPKGVNIIYVAENGENQRDADKWAAEYIEKHKGQHPESLTERKYNAKTKE